MDASSSSRFFTAKAEESPSSLVDVVSGLEAMTVVGASTSGRTQYYSARCEAMARSRGQFSDDVALEIEFSKPHWSEVIRCEVAPQSAEEEELNRENKALLKQLSKEYPDIFGVDVSRYVLGRMIAQGGQAGIYKVVGKPYLLMKVFERGTSLQDLRQSWPLPVLDKTIGHCIYYASILEDGRFAFLIYRYWGDLRKLIDQAMLEKSVDGIQGPPFPYKWNRNGFKRVNVLHVDLMYWIAWHMVNLHEEGVSHRDLKASNILLDIDYERKQNPVYRIVIADFECSIGVLGTKFWRAPEILATPRNASTFTHEQWKKADVYSYGMICFEIVTGQIPFDGELGNTKADRQLVIEGQRPQLPSDLDDAVKDLIMKCWEPNPSLRPTFSEIVEMVGAICTRHCQFRLFGIDDELPPQYRLATIQEVDDYPIAFKIAKPTKGIAKLANGFVDGFGYATESRFVEKTDVRYKLARLHL